MVRIFEENINELWIFCKNNQHGLGLND